MIVHDVKQGSSEWVNLRLGIPTASRFDQIVTPAKLGYSASAQRYIAELIAERHLWRPLEGGSGSWMERGTELEEEARCAYELQYDVEVQRVGFCTNDEGTVGCSPDGLVGDDGGLEIKCRNAQNHTYLLLGFDDPAGDAQVQGSLWVTGREWWDQFAYCPGFPPVRVRSRRKSDWMKALDEHLETFLAQLQTAQERWDRMGAKGRDDESLIADLEASVAQMYGPEIVR